MSRLWTSGTSSPKTFCSISGINWFSCELLDLMSGPAPPIYWLDLFGLAKRFWRANKVLLVIGYLEDNVKWGANEKVTEKHTLALFFDCLTKRYARFDRHANVRNSATIFSIKDCRFESAKLRIVIGCFCYLVNSYSSKLETAFAWKFIFDCYRLNKILSNFTLEKAVKFWLKPDILLIACNFCFGNCCPDQDSRQLLQLAKQPRFLETIKLLDLVVFR